MQKKVIVGIRPSLLAYKQFEEIQRRQPHLSMKAVVIRTSGDEDKVTPLTLAGNANFFTDEIERALLDGSIDAAVHSAKDLEEDIPEGLAVVAVTKSVSPYDCLVSGSWRTLDSLEEGARVGTSSAARREGIEKYRGDLVVKDIRGNVDERLRQLDSGNFEAIIVAHAALIRLGLARRIAQLISPDIIQPHPLQGRLAVQIRKDRKDLREAFEGIDEQ